MTYDIITLLDREPVPPRPSCPQRVHLRNALLALLPGYSKRIAGHRVTRAENWRKPVYRVDGMELALDDAVTLLMGGYQADILRARYAPPPRVFASVLGQVGDVATVQRELFVVGEAA